MKNKKTSSQRILRIAQLALLADIAIVLVCFIHFPIFPAAPFLEYDPADVMIIIGTLLFGTVPGLILTVVVSLVQGLTVSTQSGSVGILMHIAATGTYVLAAGLIHRRRDKIVRTVAAMTAGTVAMTAIMILWNIILTPIFMKAPREVVLGMIIPIFIPFNLFKAGVNSVIAFVLYGFVKRVPIIARSLKKSQD